MNPERTDLLQTRLREKDSAENESLLDIDNDDSDEDDNSGRESSSERDESNDVILAFIDDDEEVALASPMTKKLRGQPQHVREEP